MRQTYGANFISQSVAILAPVLVFLGPFVAFSIAMQWDFSSRESFNLFYGLFFGGVIWFLVCVAACLCASPPRLAPSEALAPEGGVWRYVRKFLKFILMLFCVSVCLMLMHKYDLSAKRERYEVVHKKFCELDLSQPLQRLMQTHDTYGQVEQKHWAVNTVKDSYMDALNTVSAWVDASSWETTVVLTNKDSFSLINGATNYLPIQKKSVYNYAGFESLPDPLVSPFCGMVHIDGRWKSLRTFSYNGQKPTFILTRVREEKNRY